MKLGILKERKARIDNRVALTPEQCKSLLDKHVELEIYIEPSEIRCFDDKEYEAVGVLLTADLSDCEALIGVKEVPISDLISNKTYFFFSHTIKKQSYNRKLLQALVDKNIRMIDYECILDDSGSRVLGFGHWAGIVGAHNGLLNYGKKMNLYELPPAHSFREYSDLIEFYKKLKLPTMRIATTGSGRVSHGLVEVMERIGAKNVLIDELPLDKATEVETVHFPMELLYENESGGFDRNEFFSHPEKYRCVFRDYTSNFDILMNGIFWKEDIDILFDKEQISKPSWQIKTIADVTCDTHGSVPINEGSTDIANPSYGIDRQDFTKLPAYEPFEKSVDVMAVDNLPNELPRDASREFGSMMASVVVPELLNKDSRILKTGCICENGALTERFSYLQDFYEGQD